jgi:integration host factor subunit beta
MMIKSELVDVIAGKDLQLERADIERAVNLLLEHMSLALAAGERIEIRGFGSFSLRFRRPCLGRNPKTGEAVSLPGKHVLRFKPGKLLRDRVNAARMH